MHLSQPKPSTVAAGSAQGKHQEKYSFRIASQGFAVVGLNVIISNLILGKEGIGEGRNEDKIALQTLNIMWSIAHLGYKG